MNIKSFKEYLYNPYIFFLFLISTLFFLFQHYWHLSWDFSAYVLNARYLFNNGTYFEVYRAPLTSLLLGFFLVFGKFGEYLFIFFVSGVYFYSIIDLSESLYLNFFYKYRIKRELFAFLFYLFSLSPFVLFYGVLIGTELLALSFFILFLSYLFRGKISGFFLGLAFLTRYNFLMFLPFLFFNKSYKKIFLNFLSFFVILFPWFLFNFLSFGNFFSSIVDSYYLNIVARQGMVESFNIIQLLPVFNYLLPIFLLGLGVFVFFLFKSKISFKQFKIEFIFLFVFIFSLMDFLSVPFKIIRYLFNLTLPISFFSVYGIVFLFNRNKGSKRFFKILLFILSFLFFLSLVVLSYNFYMNRNADVIYKDTAQSLRQLGLVSCLTLSPHWVPINYYIEQVNILPYNIESALKKNEVVVIYPNHKTQDDLYYDLELNYSNKLIDKGSYIIFGNSNLTQENCKKWEIYNSPLKKDPCEIISKKFSVFQGFVLKTCNFVNFKF